MNELTIQRLARDCEEAGLDYVEALVSLLAHQFGHAATEVARVHA